MRQQPEGGPRAADVLQACARVGWVHEVLTPNNPKLEYLIRLDTTDPDVHLACERESPYAVAVMDLPVLDEDRALLRRLDPARRDLATAKVLRGWASLGGVQWNIRNGDDDVWAGFQFVRRIYPEQLAPGDLWTLVESVVDAGFVVRAALLELRAENGQSAVPAPLPRVRAVEIVQGIPDYTVVHASKEAARWIHEKALQWEVSTEAVVDRLVARERGKALRPD